MSTPIAGKLGESVLEVSDLRMYYTTSAGEVKAVDDLNFSVRRGEVLGVVGESGCGKSSLALTIMKLLPSNAKILSGRILVKGEDVVPMPDSEVRRKVRWSEISMIPQGAMNSLNPIFRVGDQIAESILAHSSVSKGDAKKKAAELLALVGIDPSRVNNYPHEFSGGMKQRAMIAMSLALDPALLIADEPTSALDVVTQRQVMETINRVQKAIGAAVILIGHDMGLMAQFVDKVAVMYAGRLVELSSVRDIFISPLHPYAQALISSLPRLENKGVFQGIPGLAPSLLRLPGGCAFHPRCPRVMEVCRSVRPELLPQGDSRSVACHLYSKRPA